MEQKNLTMEVDRKEFAMALKKWRLRQGFSQEKVGTMFGLSRYTIISLEKARDVSWTTAYRAFAKMSYYLTEEGMR